MINNFETYVKLIKIKNSFIEEDLDTILDKLKSNIFKSEDYLSSIIDKEIKDLTPSDLMNLIITMCNPLNDKSWSEPFIMKDDQILSYIHGIYNFSISTVNINIHGFEIEEKYRDERNGSTKYIEFGIFDKKDRLKLVETILNYYKYYKLNEKLNPKIRSFHNNFYNSYNGNTNWWENLYTHLLQTDINLIENINFDYSKIDKKYILEYKSKKTLNKFNL